MRFIFMADFFIEDSTGTPLAIECNPRFSSNITNFYNSPTVGKAYLEPDALVKAGKVELPMPTHEETCWIACELFYTLTDSKKTLLERAYAVYEAFFVKKDAYWDPDDVLPFLALYYIHVPTLLIRNIARGNKWKKIDLCIGKLTEINGD